MYVYIYIYVGSSFLTWGHHILHRIYIYIYTLEVQATKQSGWFLG